MEDREQLWTDMHESYLGRKPYSLVPLKDRLAAICLTLRDAPWAAGLFPTWSEVLPDAGSEQELQRLAAWLRSDEPAP